MNKFKKFTISILTFTFTIQSFSMPTFAYNNDLNQYITQLESSTSTVEPLTEESSFCNECNEDECINVELISNYETKLLQEEFEASLLEPVPSTVLEQDYFLVTDLPIDYSKSFVEPGYGIRKNMNNIGSKLTLRVDGGLKTFEYGISAWATSEVYFDISQYTDSFDYLTAYVGSEYHNTTEYLNYGAYMFISTSIDGVNWQRQYTSSLKTSFHDADFVKIPLNGANYIRFEGDKDGTGWWHYKYDEVCFTDIKLIKEGYEEDVVTNPTLKTVEQLDQEIFNASSNTSESYYLLTMQRSLLSTVDYNDLTYHLGTDPQFKEAFEWLYYDYENMRDYMLGGDPDGGYMSALFIWRDLFHENYDDLYAEGFDEHCEYKDLYRRMLFTLSLTHSLRVGHWLYDYTYSEPWTSNSSDANTRYAIFKKLYHDDLLDNTIFPYLEIEEMRMVMNNIIDDESIEWTNWYITKSAENGISKYHHVAYLNGYNYWDEQYYSQENYDMWDEKYNFSEYGMAYDSRFIKNWVVYEEGAVCGGISKTGSNHEGAFGVPSSVVSQPGHAAFIDYRLNEDGDAYWSVLNNISGWQQSGRTEKLTVRMPNGWGDGSYARAYPASYIFLAQDALNDFDAYEKSELVLFQANSYQNDPIKLEEIYREALSHYDKNFDAWLGLTYLYRDTNKTEAEVMELIHELGTTLQYFPYPCHDLLEILNTLLSSSDNKIIYTMLVDGWLKAVENVTEEESIQAAQIKLIVAYMKNTLETSIASFSFTGDNPNTIILADQFIGSQVNWDYSLDSGETWNVVEGDRIELSDEELNSITVEDSIRVHLIGLNYENENIIILDITTGIIDSKITANDIENKIVGDTTYLEWRKSESDPWIKFVDQEPDLSGDCILFVRTIRNNSSIASDVSIFDFTTNPDQDPYHQYISIDNIEMIDFSNEQDAAGEYAHNIIDANPNTMWHSSYGGDSEKFITVKLDKPVYLSRLEYLPRNSGTNGRVLTAEIYTSLDGEEFTHTTTASDWANNNVLKTIEFEQPVATQYIKFHASQSVGNFISGLLLNFYEDTTIKTTPNAQIDYSSINPTNENVTVTLTNPSEHITIINNEGNNTYTFEDNGTFEFIIESAFGVVNTITADVQNIDKINPTASIEYNKNTDSIVATIVDPSEQITITNNNGLDYYTFTQNGTFEFEFIDLAGNIGSVLATADFDIEDVPQQPEIPEVPQEPEIPSSPEQPEIPEVPQVPEEVPTPDNNQSNNNTAVTSPSVDNDQSDTLLEPEIEEETEQQKQEETIPQQQTNTTEIPEEIKPSMNIFVVLISITTLSIPIVFILYKKYHI